MPEKFPEQDPKEEREKSELWLEDINVRELLEGLKAAEESERSERGEWKKMQKKIDVEKEEILSRIKSTVGVAKFQEMVEEEMRRTGGKTEVDRAKAIKSVMEKLG